MLLAPLGMVLFFSSLSIFFLLFLLVSFFHLFFWRFVKFAGGGLRSWVSPFECGFLSHSVTEKYFSYTYFVLLVFFVIFDLEISLLLNIPFQGVLYKNFFCYGLFLILLSIGFGVEVHKGYAD